jgi:RNase adaptor protein for sRNA GlmZ degradation
MTCVLMSGQIAAGKTTVARLIAERRYGKLLRVRDALASMLDIDPADREILQREGAALDARTQGRWLVERVLEDLDRTPFVVVDAMRTERQTLPLLNLVPNVDLIYLEAHPATRRDRYALSARTDPAKRRIPFEQAMAHGTELDVQRLRHWAAIIDVGLAHPAPHRLRRNIEISRDLVDRQITATGDRDHVTLELRREPLGHRNILRARRSSHMGCQPNPRQIPSRSSSFIRAASDVRDRGRRPASTTTVG